MTTDQLDAIIEIVALSDFPGLIASEWGSKRECAERGVDPHDDFDNYFMGVSADTGLGFEEMDRIAKSHDKYWHMVVRFKSLIS